MKLPEGFQYSQSSLQDFIDCRRRFFLRHISHLSWPMLETEPADEFERATRLGAQFHRLVHQLLVGIPHERLGASISDPGLKRCWGCFLDFLPHIYAGCEPADCRLYPEAAFSTPLGNRRLFAKYDLLCVAGGSLLIYDWKTTRMGPERAALKARLQSRVYPYLLVRSGRHINAGTPVRPEQVEMIYWFASAGESVERFPYNQALFQEDEAYLSEILVLVEQLDAGEFTQTGDENRCLFCSYRSLCDRGINPGIHSSEVNGESPVLESFPDQTRGVEFSA